MVSRPQRAILVIELVRLHNDDAVISPPLPEQRRTGSLDRVGSVSAAPGTGGPALPRGTEIDRGRDNFEHDDAADDAPDMATGFTLEQ